MKFPGIPVVNLVISDHLEIPNKNSQLSVFDFR